MPGVGRRTAEAVVGALAAQAAHRPQPAVNTATGEILDDTTDAPAAVPVVEEKP